jgi:hypothetical protein
MKAREARARKLAKRKASSDNTDTIRKSTRIASLVEEANQEFLELSLELDKVNIRDLER